MFTEEIEAYKENDESAQLPGDEVGDTGVCGGEGEGIAAGVVKCSYTPRFSLVPTWERD